MQSYCKRTRLACSALELFEWHCRPEAFLELQPPWERVRQQSEPEPLHEGQLVRIQIMLGPLPLPWHSEITRVEQGSLFIDVQRRGPFALWEHQHRFIAESSATCWLEDHISYRLPLEPLSGWIAGRLVRSRLERMFEYRHAVMIKTFGAA